jgi:uncharacterized protein
MSSRQRSKMLLRKHEGNNKLILAVCDEDILGSLYKEDGKVIDLTSDFYKGERTAEEELSILLRKAHVVNAAGKDSVAFLLKLDLIEKADVCVISGIPTAQVILRW